MRIVVTRALIVSAMLLAAAGASAFESKPGGFSVAFPGQPKVEDKATSRGAERWHTLVKDGHSYIVVYYVPAADVKALPLDQLMNAEEKGLRGDATIVRKRDFKLGAHPAREIESKTNDGFVFMTRIVVTPQRIFEILTATRASALTSQQKAFVTSFGIAAD